MSFTDEMRYFGVIDYAVFGILLAFSALIGIYFAFCKKQKQNTISEYLLGSKKMGVFPISMSLIARFVLKLDNLAFNNFIAIPQV